MTPMTPEEHAEVGLHMPYQHRVATPALVALVASLADGTDGRSLDAYPGDVRAVIARLLAAERDLAALRRVIGQAVADADDSPDYGLSAGELLHILTGAGLDLDADIAAAKALRIAEQTAGTW